MEASHFSAYLTLFFIGFLFPSMGVSVGVNYGQIANNLPSPEHVVPLVKAIGATRVKLYDADPKVLKAFANTGVEFTVGLGNEYLSKMTDPSNAQQWVKSNVQAYLPATKITSIAVGNEVLTFNDTSLSGCLLPAMQSVHKALVTLKLDSQVTVTTAHSVAILQTSYPPSAGAFRQDLKGCISPILDFLSKTCSPFLINAYPFFAYKANPKQVSLDFVLFQPNAGVVDPANGLHYDNMLFAQIDAVYAALGRLGYKKTPVQISETGWPSKGDEDEVGASPENAKKYNGNLLKMIGEKRGTPAKPNVDLNIFVFAMFNENLKPGPTSERNYGLFKPDGTPAYGLGFTGIGVSGGNSTGGGSATLGILLLQDIAVVPLLVILPVLESQNLVQESILPMLVKESLKALGGLGLLSLGGKFLLRRVFEVVAEARSSEAFVALCLLTVAGTSLITQKLGFSDTLGAFLAGALLAETNFRTQIEADIRPFRGLLLGLFFVTTGTSIDMQLLFREWPNVLSLLAGLIAIKTLIITAIGPRVGLTFQESVRIGLLLSQGGEFGFVVFSLANRLGVLPLELNKLLIIVVVLSMALTPLLNDLGRKAADFIGENVDEEDKPSEASNYYAADPIVILGFGQMSQVLANFLSTPLANGIDGDAGWPFVAFDLDPSVVKGSSKLGFPILYGDGSRAAVLQSAGISSPKAVMVMYEGRQRAVEAVERIRLAFPAVPIYARAQDIPHLLDLKEAGATDVILENAETSLQLGSKLLKGLGVMSDDVNFLSQLVRDSMELQAQAITVAKEPNPDVMKPLQVRVGDLVATKTSVAAVSGEEESVRISQVERDRILLTQEQPKPKPNPSNNNEVLLGEDERGVLYCQLDTNDNVPNQR